MYQQQSNGRKEFPTLVTKWYAFKLKQMNVSTILYTLKVTCYNYIFLVWDHQFKVVKTKGNKFC